MLTKGVNLTVREGKTERDKKSGSWGNRFSNRAERVAWQNNKSTRSNANFPVTSCNGKKNRSVVTVSKKRSKKS